MSAALPWLPFLLQTSDALFPTGAYAHSLGFEEIVRLGQVRDEASLLKFLEQQVIPALRDQELPYLHYACTAAAGADLDELCAIDREIHAWKLAVELRQASLALGQRRLKALQAVEAVEDASLLRAYAERMQRGEGRGHHLVVAALQAVIQGLPLEAALATWYYQALAAICAAALKLIRIGQEGCQRALRAACQRWPEILERSNRIPRATAGWFNPLLEIAAMRHERAGERLFIS